MKMSFLGIKSKKEREREREEYLKRQREIFEQEEKERQRKIREEREREREREERQREAEERKKRELEEAEARKKRELEGLIEKYKNSARVKKAAKDFAEYYIDTIKGFNMRVTHEYLSLGRGFGQRNTEIEYIYLCHNERDGVYFSFEAIPPGKGTNVTNFFVAAPALIDFGLENLQPVEGKDAIVLMRAISSIAYDLITDTLDKELLFTEYTLDIKEEYAKGYWNYNYQSRDHMFWHQDCFGIVFYFKAKNPNYQPPLSLI